LHIGVVGTGIAGLSAAWLLSRRYRVTVFEKEPRLGGHSNTVAARVGGELVDVDTGFIVYNERNYPELTAFFEHLEIATEPSSMSFSASIDGGRLEYCGASLGALFAQKRNLLRPGFYRMLADIMRFNKLGLAHLEAAERKDWTLGRFIDEHAFGQAFTGAYLLPMAAAIWSCPTATMLHFPATSFLRFFANHGLLTVADQPAWRTLTHRSKDYVATIRRQLEPNVRTAAPVVAVERVPGGVEVVDGRGGQFRFDAVVMAGHADQTAAVLLDADDEERRLLGAFQFQPNRAVLHSDPSLMPKRRAAWAAWNYTAGSLLEPGARVAVTYWMNRLQNIDERLPLFVSMNPIEEPDPALVHGEFAYDHPVFDAAAIAAQAEMPRIQGRGGIHYAGAWLGYGFHEDGLRSGLEAAARLGVRAPWKTPIGPRHDLPAAASSSLPEHAAAQSA
jgi:predicted NAD/FAD-binding protein